MKSFKRFLTEAPIRYERITLVNGKRFYLRVSDDSGNLVRGIEVDKEGDEVVPKGKDKDGNAFQQRMHLIQKDLIKTRQRMRMNLVYATLEPLDEETERSNAQEFVSRVRAWGTPAGGGNHLRAHANLGDNANIKLMAAAKLGKDVVKIESVESEPAGKGYTTQVMHRICKLADKMSIQLAVDAPDTSAGRVFYAAFGFKTNGEHMLRAPRSVDSNEP